MPQAFTLNLAAKGFVCCVHLGLFSDVYVVALIERKVRRGRRARRARRARKERKSSLKPIKINVTVIAAFRWNELQPTSNKKQNQTQTSKSEASWTDCPSLFLGLRNHGSPNNCRYELRWPMKCQSL
jgi:hypothetical protein